MPKTPKENRLTFSAAKAELKEMGIVLTRSMGVDEFRVRLATARPAQAYHTDDLKDAYDTGVFMAMNIKQKSSDEPEEEAEYILASFAEYQKRSAVKEVIEAIKKQPKNPDSVPEKPFICMTCYKPFAANAPGFITREGLPKHSHCGTPAEEQEYANANNGNGYKLDPDLFPGWSFLDVSNLLPKKENR